MEIKPKEEGELVFNDGFYVNLFLVSPSPYGVIDKKKTNLLRMADQKEWF